MKLTSGLAAVALATTAAFAPTAAVAAPVPPSQTATDWIVGELTDGLSVGSFGPDIGLSIDAGIAFDALGRAVAAESVGDAIADQLVSSPTTMFGYVKSDEYDFAPPYDFKQVGYYANATAKAAAFTQRIGRNPATEYDDVDLVAQLETLTGADGVIADDSFYGDYANTIGQAFAAEALTVAGSGEALAATEALLDQQCPAGYFRFELDAAACTTSAPSPSPDTTGLAVVSLIGSGSTSPAVLAAIEKAADWLVSVQLDDGSLDGGGQLPGSNSNSTGLGAWALGVTGHATAAAKAAAWVRSLQVGDVGTCASQAPTGAIAYDAADLAAGRANGIAGNATVRDKWRRASFQAAPALQWAPAASTPLAVSAPATAVERSSVTVTVRGVAAGEQACVSLGGDARRVVGSGSDLPVTFTLPAGAGARTFTAATLGASVTATTSATAVPVPTMLPTAPAPPVVGDLGVSRTEKVRNNRFKVEVSCTGNALPCVGKLKVRTARKVETPSGNRVVTVAKREYTLAAGEEKRLVLKVTRAGRAVLADGRVKVKAVQKAPGVERAVTTFWLKDAKG